MCNLRSRRGMVFSWFLLPALSLLSSLASGHSGTGTMDPEGNRESFTGLARISCFDDGNGAPEMLVARIRDSSAAVERLLVSVQILKGTRAISISDNVSGDADYSPYISLSGGQGTYYVIINKTAAGSRVVDLEFHCLAADTAHTGTDIIVDQWE